MRSYLRSLDPQLPRPVWLLQAGGLANSFGNGFVMPFLFIYLHDVRGFSNATAGFAIALGGLVQLASSLAAGTVVDRIGGRTTLAAALVLQAVAVASFTFIHRPWHAFALVTLEGIGTSGFWPAQSALMARLTPSARRPAAYAQQRLTMNLGIGLGGLAGGLIATTANPGSFTVLFGLDAMTFFAFVAVLPFVADHGLTAEEREGGPARYIEVFRDRVFMRVVGLNVVFVTAGFGPFGLLPVFAKDHAGVDERSIGTIFFINTMVVVLAALPVAKAVEGRRRMTTLALMPVLFACAWLTVLAGGAWAHATMAAVVFGVAAGLLGLGESLMGPAQHSLSAELAPPRLRGRYFAVASMSWGLGLAIAPAAGGTILDLAPLSVWPIAAGLCAAAALATLALERALPERLRRIGGAPIVAAGAVPPEVLADTV